MSINSMNSRFAMAEKMSVPQLQQSVQAGSLPAYVGVPLMEEKMREQKKAAAMAQLAAAQQQAQQYGLPTEKPIAQGVMDQASQQGITNIPSNLPEAGFNDGGIVAFAEGGDAEDFDYEEYQDEQDAEEYNNVLRSYMEQIEAAGLEGIPIHRTKKVEMGVEKKADGGIIGLNAGGIPRFQSGELVEDQDSNPVRNFLSQNVISPARSAINFFQERNERMRNADPDSPEGRALAQYAPREIDILESLSPPGNREYSVPISEQVRNLGARISDATRPNEANIDPRVRAYTDRGMFSNLPPEEAPAEAQPETANPEALGSEFGAQGILTPFNAPAGARSATNIGGGRGDGGGGGGGGAPSQGSVRERPKSAFEQFIANVKEERAALDKQKRSDKYMALLTAGLGMMSGTSPNAFANIGQGAQAGVASYAASGKQRAAERAALNKNLLMGQRYQSMEDIAGRTADINEARYKDASAVRAAGSGDAASLKQERLLNQREADLNRAIGTKTTAIQKQLETQFGKTGMYTNPNYQKEYDRLYRAGIAPLETQLNSLYAQRNPDLFGPNSDFQAPQLAAPPEGVTVRKVK
jgi:hypothetical protein